MWYALLIGHVTFLSYTIGSKNGLSQSEYALFEEIEEKFKHRVTPENFNERFSAAHQKIIAEHYNALTPPSEIPSKVQQLVDLANSTSFKKLHPVQRAAILGFRLVNIHPFDDGNGSMFFS